MVIVRRDEFVLATREKFHEVAEKLSRLGEAPELVELQKRKIAAKQDPMVDLVDRFKIRIYFLQQRVAKRMECAERDCFGPLDSGFAALAGRGYHAMFHFRGGLVGERQAKDFRSGQFRLSFEQIADALGNDARLSRACAGHNNQRSCTMMCRCALLRIKLNPRSGSAGVVKQVGHRNSSCREQ